MRAKTLLTVSLLALGGAAAALPSVAAADAGPLLLAERGRGHDGDAASRNERRQRQEAAPTENPRDLGYGYGYERREADRARWHDRNR